MIQKVFNYFLKNIDKGKMKAYDLIMIKRLLNC